MIKEIGEKANFTYLPKVIEIEDRPFIINTNEKGDFVLFSAICPHLHGIVNEVSSKEFRCPHHGWIYDSKDGKSINSPPAYLQSFPITVKDNKLFADIPIIKKNFSEDHDQNISKGPKISVISNACMLIEYNGSKLLTDPWIEGPAVFGSWVNYPPCNTKVENLPKIDAIWISHEHSDHLHHNTLEKMSKDIPIFVPKIEDDRLGKIIKKIGFRDVISMPSFESFNITNSIEAISFKSASIWNDGILFLRTGDFKMLNFNDAGINWNIKNKIGHVDLVCSSFSQSASSYPSNWTHLNEFLKNKIMDDRNQGILKMLKQMVDEFNARYLLPIASFNALWHPDHLKYEKMKKRNSLIDIKEFFANEKVKVLDLLPGESWNGQNEKISRIKEREKFFDEKYRLEYLKRAFKEGNPDMFIPSKFDLKHEELKEYFMRFNNAELTKYVGNMRLCLRVFDIQRSLIALISFKEGKISYQELTEPVESELSISCPGAMVQEIIQNDLSWDEIMYWSTLHRNPNIHNLAFWRLLHAPWRVRSSEKIDFKLKALSDISIATLVENGGEKITKILEKYGMYCSGCPPSVGENLQDGCNIHGVSDQDMKKISKEIQEIIELKK